MISLFKGLIPGALLTYIVSMVFGSGGTRAGFLYVHQVAISSYEFYWSWPLFVGATALSWVVFLMLK